MKVSLSRLIMLMSFGWSLIGFSTICVAEDGPAVNQVRGSLSVMVLGSGGPQLQPSGRASAGYLIFTDGKPRILMDAGGGIFQRMAQSGSDIATLDLVLLSHLHIDHSEDLPAVMKGIYFAGRLENNPHTKPIRIWGPNSNKAAFLSISDYFQKLFDTGGVYAYLPSFVNLGGLGVWSYQATGLSPDFVNDNTINTILTEDDGLVIKAVAVDHFDTPAVAYRIEYKGHSIVYSGDTHSTTDNMINLAKNADLLIYDTSILDTAPPAPSPFARRHTTPTRLGQVAADANPRKLVLSHITPISDPAIATIKQIIVNQNYSGYISVARDLKVYNLDDDD